MPRKLCLVDGSNHAFRVFHAMPRLTAAGRHTGALLGFANLLRVLDREEKADFCAVVFDAGPSFRTELFADYKGHRPDMPEELSEQWPEFPRLVEAWGFRCLALPGVEADDVIATLACRHAGPDLEVRIVSGDKDFTQVVSEHVHILDMKTGERREVGVPEVRDRYGVGPEHMVDVLALWGDASDNVPGVPGIGEKKATALVQQYGDLEALLARAADVKGKMGENLRQFADQARLSRELVTLRRDLELPVRLEDLARRPPDVAALRSQFLRYQFRQHLEELEETQGAAAVSVVDRDRYRTVTTEEALRDAVEACRAAGRFAFDTETTSKNALEAELVGCSLCWSEDDAVYVPFGHREGPQLPRERVLALLAPLLADPAVGKIGQNLKYDLQVLRGAGVELAGIDGDTMLADYLLEPGRETHRLDDLAMRVLGHRTITYAEATDGLPEGSTFADVPIPLATRYCGEDAHVAWLLDRRLAPRLREEGLDTLYREVELPLVPVLADMERHGIGLDREALEALGRELGERICEKEREIHLLAGHPFNINSPRQLAEVLYDEQGYTSLKKTRLTSARSTDAQTLENLALALPENPLPASVLEYRGLVKLKGTYVDALPGCVSPLDGRVHTSLHQAVAATGRLASSDPNLQNIPIRTPIGRRIRACFVADPGHVFLSADYSQIELRVLADYCGAGTLVDAFRRREDIHRRTAAEIFGLHPDLVTSDQRRAAKAINFGLAYGMSAFRLAADLGISRRQAQKFIDEYFARYPQVRGYMDAAVARAREEGAAVTRFGRRRMVADLRAHLRHVREAAERIAINTPIQGTAADIMKVAMARTWARLRADHPRARLLLQVHDELLVEVPEEEADAVARAVVLEMEAAATLAVPLVVEVGRGRNWDEAH